MYFIIFYTIFEQISSSNEDEKLMHSTPVRDLIQNVQVFGKESKKRDVVTHIKATWGLDATVALEIEKLVNFVMRDFVNMWFDTLSDDPDFPWAVKEVLANAMSILVQRGQTRIDLISFVCDRVTNCLLKTLKTYRLAKEHVIEANPEIFDCEPVVSEDWKILQMTMADEFRKHGRLHALFALRSASSSTIGVSNLHLPATSGSEMLPNLTAAEFFDEERIKDCESRYLRHLSSLLFPLLIPNEDDRKCRAVKYLFRELLGSCVLSPVVGLFVPPTINYWISIARGCEIVARISGKSNIGEKEEDETNELNAFTSDDGQLQISKLTEKNLDESKGKAPSGYNDDPAWQYLAGTIELKEVEAILVGRPIGTFLIRAMEMKGYYSLSFVHSIDLAGTPNVVHALFMATPPCTFELVSMDIDGESSLEVQENSLSKFLEKLKHFACVGIPFSELNDVTRDPSHSSDKISWTVGESDDSRRESIDHVDSRDSLHQHTLNLDDAEFRYAGERNYLMCELSGAVDEFLASYQHFESLLPKKSTADEPLVVVFSEQSGVRSVNRLLTVLENIFCYAAKGIGEEEDEKALNLFDYLRDISSLYLAFDHDAENIDELMDRLLDHMDELALSLTLEDIKTAPLMFTEDGFDDSTSNASTDISKSDDLSRLLRLQKDRNNVRGLLFHLLLNGAFVACLNDISLDTQSSIHDMSESLAAKYWNSHAVVLNKESIKNTIEICKNLHAKKFEVPLPSAQADTSRRTSLSTRFSFLGGSEPRDTRKSTRRNVSTASNLPTKDKRGLDKNRPLSMKVASGAMNLFSMPVKMFNNAVSSNSSKSNEDKCMPLRASFGSLGSSENLTASPNGDQVIAELNPVELVFNRNLDLVEVSKLKRDITDSEWERRQSSTRLRNESPNVQSNSITQTLTNFSSKSSKMLSMSEDSEDEDSEFVNSEEKGKLFREMSKRKVATYEKRAEKVYKLNLLLRDRADVTVLSSRNIWQDAPCKCTATIILVEKREVKTGLTLTSIPMSNQIVLMYKIFVETEKHCSLLSDVGNDEKNSYAHHLSEALKIFPGSEENNFHANEDLLLIEHWEVVRRFSDFEDLHNAIRKNTNHFLSGHQIMLPPKHNISVSSNNQFMDKRKDKLQDYLNSIGNYLPNCDELKVFLSTSGFGLTDRTKVRSHYIFRPRKKGVLDWDYLSPRDDGINDSGHDLDVLAAAKSSGGRNPRSPVQNRSISMRLERMLFSKRSKDLSPKTKPPTTLSTRNLDVISEKEQEEEQEEKLELKIDNTDTKPQAEGSRGNTDVPKIDMAVLDKRLYPLLKELLDAGKMNPIMKNLMTVLFSSIKMLFSDKISAWMAEQSRDAVSHKTTAVVVQWITGVVWPDGKLLSGGESQTPEEDKLMRSLNKEFIVSKLKNSYVSTNQLETSFEKLQEIFDNPYILKSFLFMVIDALFMELFPELTGKLAGMDSMTV